MRQAPHAGRTADRKIQQGILQPNLCADNDLLSAFPRQERSCRFKVFHSTFVNPQFPFMDGFVGEDYAKVAQSFGTDTPPAFWREVMAVDDVVLKNNFCKSQKRMSQGR